MISKSDFNNLRHGDVVLWRNGSSAVYRTVIDGPADKDEREGNAVTLAIRRRSWTGRAYTVYGWNDIKHRIKLIKKTSLVMLAEERDRLKDIGFNVRRELARTLKEARAYKQRRGFELCERKWRLPA